MTCIEYSQLDPYSPADRALLLARFREVGAARQRGEVVPLGPAEEALLRRVAEEYLAERRAEDAVWWVRLFGQVFGQAFASGVASGIAKTEAVGVAAPPVATRRASTAVVSLVSADADLLDQNRSPLTKRKHLELCRKGVLPCVKDGKQRLVRRADIEAYLTRTTKPGKPSDVDTVDRELAAFDDVLGGSE